MSESVPQNEDSDKGNDNNARKLKKYKIVVALWNQDFESHDFDTETEAKEFWNSLPFMACLVKNKYVFFEYDPVADKYKLKRSYGIESFVDSIIAYVVSSTGHKPSSHEDPKGEEEKHLDSAQDDELISGSTTPLGDLMQWAQNTLEGIDVKPTTSLEKDDKNATDLVISEIWGTYQCYFCPSFESAFDTWNKLGSWYGSVWFKRQQQIWVLKDSYGTGETVRKICWYLDEAQTQWAKNEEKGTEKSNNLPQSDTSSKPLQHEVVEKEHQDDQLLCVVCLDKNRNYIVLPCAHVCLCEQCSQLGEYHSDSAACPICRGKIEKLTKVFL
ncbi:hypothetical protein RFI_07734 [Reticulomyxa filosa]|uniref:RING-type domain-containing protein n=1 Tax=Reticulomyxa filosa TaxID=46433 RepID=X6NTU9_RETFI|nr:hypothetical protein RFI_07734 [Reticulomyxa filosa]|eukprot:ETO29391.1 hypothetical protein RFI_07734 [Reticulomyxa filosa]